MTLFAALISRLALSQAQAAELLDVRLDTLKSWSSGRRTCPHSVIIEIRDHIQAIEQVASDYLKDWNSAGRPETFTYFVANESGYAIAAALRVLLPDSVELVVEESQS